MKGWGEEEEILTRILLNFICIFLDTKSTHSFSLKKSQAMRPTIALSQETELSSFTGLLGN